MQAFAEHDQWSNLLSSLDLNINVNGKPFQLVAPETRGRTFLLLLLFLICIYHTLQSLKENYTEWY